MFCQCKNPAYLTPLVKSWQKFSFRNYYSWLNHADLINGYRGGGNLLETNNANEFLLLAILANKEKVPFEALKPLYDTLAEAKLHESILPEVIAAKETEAYRYLIDHYKAEGRKATVRDGLKLYPYHLLLVNNDFEYAAKVKFSPNLCSDPIEIPAEGKCRDKAPVPVEYMAEINNFPAVKHLIEKENCEYGTAKNYNEAKNAVDWAKKNGNKEMEKYLDDHISTGASIGHALLFR